MLSLLMSLVLSVSWDFTTHQALTRSPSTAKFLKMDGERGPKYIGVASGTTMDDTGHIGYTFAQLCRDMEAMAKVPGRKANETAVTVVELDLELSRSNGRQGTEGMTLIRQPATFTSTPWRHIVAFVTILFSIGASAVCGVFREWYAFTLILLGMVCNGLACYIIGTADIYLKHPKPSEHSPPGDGIVVDGDQFIVLKGTEEAINWVAKGKFVVEYGRDKDYHRIGTSATALLIQFIAQLFLIPQSGLFGQILFLATLAISWVNHACLSSIDKDDLVKEILKQNLPVKKEVGRKYVMPNRTAAVVFAMLCALPLKELDSVERDSRVRGILASLLPTGTKVWSEWADLVARKIDEVADGKEASFEVKERNGLLKHLLEASNIALEEFWKHRGWAKETAVN